jgi:hypothetical protein
VFGASVSQADASQGIGGADVRETSPTAGAMKLAAENR